MHNRVINSRFKPLIPYSVLRNSDDRVTRVHVSLWRSGILPLESDAGGDEGEAARGDDEQKTGQQDRQ